MGTLTNRTSKTQINELASGSVGPGFHFHQHNNHSRLRRQSPAVYNSKLLLFAELVCTKRLPTLQSGLEALEHVAKVLLWRRKTEQAVQPN